MAKKSKAKEKGNKKIEKSIILRSDRPQGLGVYSPADMRNEINRWFEDLRSAMETRLFNPWVPANAFIDIKEPSMDIIDKGHEFEIHADMPGIPKEKIEINVTPTQIEISGEHEKSQDEKRKDYVRQERVFSQFYRATSLPAEVVADKAEATVANGVLIVRLPKKEPTPEKKVRKVPVK